MEKIKSFKAFTEKKLKIKSKAWYNTLNEGLPQAKLVFNNVKNEKKYFDCDRSKILKIINLLKSNVNHTAIENFCLYISKENLSNFKEIKLPNIDNITEEEFKKEREKIKIAGFENAKYLLKKMEKSGISVPKNGKIKNSFENIILLLDVIYFDFDRKKEILKDNKFILDKLYFLNDKELKYSFRNPFVLSLIEKMPFSVLMKILKENKKGQTK